MSPQIHALITGPFDTPYEGGFFLFLFRCPPDYPIHPPRVKLITTGHNTVRFNPNFYPQRQSLPQHPWGKYDLFLWLDCHIQVLVILIIISSKSWFISLIPFKKWNLYNVYIHSTQTDIFQVFISFHFDDYKHLVQGVNGRLLDNCQVSSLPHDCVAYRTRLRDHLKAFAGVLS